MNQTITRKEEVVKRQGAASKVEVQAAVERLNKMLAESDELPLTVKGSDLGGRVRVRNEVMAQLRGAGYYVRGKDGAAADAVGDESLLEVG